MLSSLTEYNLCCIYIIEVIFGHEEKLYLYRMYISYISNLYIYIYISFYISIFFLIYMANKYVYTYILSFFVSEKYLLSKNISEKDRKYFCEIYHRNVSLYENYPRYASTIKRSILCYSSKHNRDPTPFFYTLEFV